ncbi:hypothetical protein [Microviridae sp.]|nr:hypothetical protein [Microviridae sp.]
MGMFSSILGGVGDLFNAKQQHSDNKFDRRVQEQDLALRNLERGDQYRFAQESAGWQMQDLFDTAEANGIHKLAALGGAAGSTYSPGQSLSSGSSSNSSLAGDLIGDGLKRLDKRKAEKRQDKLDNQSIKESNARIKADEAEAQMLEARSRTVIQDGRRSGTSGTQSTVNNSTLQEVISGKKTSSGIDRADTDNPPELEADLWAWARDGTFNKNLKAVIRKNLSPKMQYRIKKAHSEKERKRVAKAIIQQNELIRKETNKVKKRSRGNMAGY